MALTLRAFSCGISESFSSLTGKIGEQDAERMLILEIVGLIGEGYH